MRPIAVRAVLASSVLALSAAGCQKAEFEKARPDAVTVLLSTDAVSADDATIVVTALALQDGVPLLEYPVNVSITGAANVPAQDVFTDAELGAAVAVFNGLTTAGDYTVTVTALDVQASDGFTVTPGVADTLSFSLDSDQLAAGTSTGWTAEVRDANANVIADAPVLVTTTAEGASYLTPDSLRFTRTGSFDVLASVTGTVVAGVDSVDVNAAAAAQILTTLDRSAVGQLQTLRITCAEMDAFGNSRNTTFMVADVSTDDPSAIVTAVVGTANAFDVSGFGEPGPRTATCASGALDDSKGFNVVSQTATNTVVATLSQSVTDYQDTLVVNCRELDPFGATLPRPAGDFGVSYPTVPGVATPQSDGSADGDATDGIDFVIGVGGSLDELGEYEVQCAADTQTDLDNFVVADLTPPAIAAADIAMATGPNGVTLDRAYAPNTSFGVDVEATDAVGVLTIDIEATSGPGTANERALFPADQTTANATLAAAVDGAAATFASITYRVIARDAAGNLTSFDIPAVTVDPAVGIAVATGVEMRTLYEDATGTSGAVALGTDLDDLFVQRENESTGEVLDVLRLDGDAAPATVSTEVGVNLPPAPAAGGIAATTLPYGGFSVFHTLDAEAVDGTTIGTANTGAHLTFAGPNGTLAPGDLTLGDLGQGRTLFLEDEGGAVFTVDTAGGIAAYTGVIGTNLSLTVNAGTLWAIDDVGQLTAVTDTGGGAIVGAPADTTVAPVRDLGFGNGRLIVGGGALVTRVDPMAPGVPDHITDQLDDVRGVAVKMNGNLYVLDQPAPGLWRVYRVTGY